MKRLLVYSTQLMETGGIESHMQEFCRNMTATDVEIDLVVLNSVILPETEAFYRQYCKIVYLGNQGRSYLRLIWLLSTALQLRTKSYDALYTNGQGESIGLFAKLIRLKGPWVHHHHTAGDADDRSTWGDGYRQTLLKAGTVIACSGRNALDMATALKRQVDSIPCFSRKITVRDYDARLSGKVRFGYYGRLIPEKGIDTLCQLSEDVGLPDTEFHIWGEGQAYPPSFFKSYPNINYHGTFSGLAELTEAINNIDGFLLLSTHPEGLPISLLEAMSAGLPWLATNRGGIPDIVVDPLSTRVIPSNADYEQVRNAVELFAMDIQQKRVSRSAQEKLYEQKFSSTALIRQWGQILKLNPIVA